MRKAKISLPTAKRRVPPRLVHRRAARVRLLPRTAGLMTRSFLLLLPITVRCCTMVTVKSPTGEIVVANTVESGDYVEQHGGHFVHKTLRGDLLGGGNGTGCGGDCALPPGLEPLDCSVFPAKYGFVGQMNEHGLFVSHHMLRLSVYEPRAASSKGVCARDVDQWLLATFATVSELIKFMQQPNRIRIVADPDHLPPGAYPITYTWSVVDAAGDAIVLEFVQGALRVHNNTIGVLTNDPTWDWHVANLNNYVGLQRTWPKPNTKGIEVPIDDQWYPWRDNDYYDPHPPHGAKVAVPAPIGHGFNLLGLPGDGGGPSRFVKAFFQRQYALAASPPKDLEGALILGQELLNTVYKVKGAVASMDASDPLETTPVAMLGVPKQKVVYHRGRADMTWRKIALGNLSFAPREGPRKHARVASASFWSIDVTSFLEP